MKPPSEAVAETPTLIALPPWPVLLFAALGFCGMADTVGRQIAGMLHGGWGLLSLAGAALSLALSAWILLMVFHGRARGFQLFLCYFTVVLLGYGTLKGVLNMNTSPLSISWGETAAAIAGIGLLLCMIRALHRLKHHAFFHMPHTARWPSLVRLWPALLVGVVVIVSLQIQLASARQTMAEQKVQVHVSARDASSGKWLSDGLIIRLEPESTTMKAWFRSSVEVSSKVETGSDQAREVVTCRFPAPLASGITVSADGFQPKTLPVTPGQSQTIEVDLDPILKGP